MLIYNILRSIALTCYKPFMKEKTKKFISKRVEQDFSFLSKDTSVAHADTGDGSVRVEALPQTSKNKDFSFDEVRGRHAVPNKPVSEANAGDSENKKDYIWVHCSSVGEVNLSESLVKKFHSVFKKNILLSVFTDTGYENAKKKYAKYPKIKIIYFPLDDKKKIQEILSRINLKILVLIETEIWFNLINECKKNSSRVIVVNGRISDKSFKNYNKIKFLLKSLFKKIDYFYMQSEEDKNKIISLGADKNKVESVGNLKFDISLEKYTKDELEAYREFLQIKDKKVFVAGSTRTGEDEILLDVFSQIKNYILVIVPRHLERLEKIETLIKERGFTFVRYSELQTPKNTHIDVEKNFEVSGQPAVPNEPVSEVNAGDKNNFLNCEKFDIILVDKMGVLKKLYAISDVAFVGGTLVNVGGHNLLEPLFYRKPLIFGEYLQNVKDISKEILKRKIGYCVKNSDDFVEAIKNIENSWVAHADAGDDSPRVEATPQTPKNKDFCFEVRGRHAVPQATVSEANAGKNKFSKAIDNFFEENKLLSLKIVKKENKIMNLDNTNKIDTNNIEDKKKDLWRHFFHSPRSNYNIYMMKLLDYPDYIIYDNELMKANKNKWNEYFKNNWETASADADCFPLSARLEATPQTPKSNSEKENKNKLGDTTPEKEKEENSFKEKISVSNNKILALEIGSGSGNFVSKLARRNKDKNYLALELRFKRLCLAAKKCEREKLNNIIFLRKRAEELLDFLGENEISELYINFPDPWENNEKNRVIQEKLFENLDIIMKKDGMIFFKTDHDIYYQDVLDLVKNLENYEVIYHTNDLHNTEKAVDNIRTEFEELFLHKHNKNINYIEIKKTK